MGCTDSRQRAIVTNMTTADNIKAMIQSVQDERALLRARDEMLRQREATLFSWLKEEKGGATQPDLPINGEMNPLNTFLTVTLTPGKRFSAGSLGLMASDRGLIQRAASPGRVVHGALLGLQTQGYVKKNDDGTWSKQ